MTFKTNDKTNDGDGVVDYKDDNDYVNWPLQNRIRILTEKADDKVPCIYSNLLLATTKQNTTDNIVCECNEPNQQTKCHVSLAEDFLQQELKILNWLA